MSSRPKTKNQTSAIVGVPWYSKRSWKTMKEISEDPGNFHDSYHLWLAEADKSIVLLTNHGRSFERLKIDPVSYSWWCENQSIKRNQESRRAYIQYLLENKISND